MNVNKLTRKRLHRSVSGQAVTMETMIYERKSDRAALQSDSIQYAAATGGDDDIITSSSNAFARHRDLITDPAVVHR